MLYTKSTAWFNFEKLLDLQGQLCWSRAYVGPPGTKRWRALGSDFFWTSSHHLISTHDIPMISPFLKVSFHSIFIFETSKIPSKILDLHRQIPWSLDFEVMPWCLRPWRPCHPCRFWPWPCPMGSRHKRMGAEGSVDQPISTWRKWNSTGDLFFFLVIDGDS